MKVFIAGLSHETNSFSPIETTVESFEADLCYRPPGNKHRDLALGFPGYGDLVAMARLRGDIAIEGPCLWCQPSAPITRHEYQAIRDEIFRGMEAAGPFDAIALNLHGAMMAQDVPDCEGDFLSALRECVGWNMPIGVLLDLHGNMTRKMVASGAIMIGVKEYPHTDYRERAGELLEILSGMVHRGIKPATTLLKLPILSQQGTIDQPMRGLVDELGELEKRDGILSVTLMHGFPWSDSEDAGASVLVISDGKDAREVTEVAEHVANRYQDIVTRAPLRFVDVDHAVDEALSVPAGTGPVIIADGSDNAGGGAASDGTSLLREMIRRQVPSAALGMIWDPEAAEVAANAGEGARLKLAIGGKASPLSGGVLEVDARVKRVRSDAFQCRFSAEPNEALGLAVALQIGNIDVIVNSIRQQVFSKECFTEMGVSLDDKEIIVVKSSQHFRSSFDEISTNIIYCNGPGALNQNLTEMPFENIRISQYGSAFSSGCGSELIHFDGAR